MAFFLTVAAKLELLVVTGALLIITGLRGGGKVCKNHINKEGDREGSQTCPIFCLRGLSMPPGSMQQWLLHRDCVTDTFIWYIPRDNRHQKI